MRIQKVGPREWQILLDMGYRKVGEDGEGGDPYVEAIMLLDRYLLIEHPLSVRIFVTKRQPCILRISSSPICFQSQQQHLIRHLLTGAR